MKIKTLGIQEKGFIKVQGREEGDKTPQPGKGSFEDFDKKMEAKGIVIGSEAYNREMQLAIQKEELNV